MAAENPTFSLEQVRQTKRNPSSEVAANSLTLARDIAAIAPAYLGEKRYEAMPEGYVRTYTVGEERHYDHERGLWVDDLTISVEETKRYRTREGIEEVIGQVIIGPYRAPLTRIVVREHLDGGGIGTTTLAHLSTPDELRGVLNGLKNGSRSDPRATNWRVLLPQQ